VKKANYVFLAAGLFILLLLFKSFGIAATINHIKAMGWRFALVAGIHIVNNSFLALAWGLFIPVPKNAAFIIKLFLARVAGDASSSINSLGAVAGEPLKAMYLQDSVPLQTGLAAVVLDRTIHSFAAILIFLTGIMAGFFLLNLPLSVSVISLAAMLFVMALMFYVLHKEKDGFIEFILSMIPAGMIRRFMNEGRWEKVKTLDKEISGLLSRENRNKFYIALSIHYTSVLSILTLEIYIIVHFIESVAAFSILHAMFVYILGFIVTSTMFFMPANLGTSEGSYSLALLLLGFDPALGLTVGMIRRLRTFVWAGIGIVILFYAGLTGKNSKRV
jgi:hypothetical protein